MSSSRNNVVGKKVSESSIEDHTYRIFPNDLNSLETVFGGLVMSIIDRLALVVAERHSGHTCVTASVDALNFLAPAGRGDNLIFHIAINRSWETSMEIGARVTAEEAKTGERKHIVSAYFSFVALDSQKQPIRVPPVLPETADEKRRFAEAEIRRTARIRRKKEIQEFRNET